MKKSLIKFIGNIKTKAFHQTTDSIKVQFTKQNLQLAEVLYKEGIFLTYFVLDSLIFLKLNLTNEHGLNNFKPIIKKYNSRNINHNSINNLSIIKNNILISTNKGIKTLETCKTNKLGGSPICKI
jgi:ribosomal protein S8